MRCRRQVCTGSGLEELIVRDRPGRVTRVGVDTVRRTVGIEVIGDVVSADRNAAVVDRGTCAERIDTVDWLGTAGTGDVVVADDIAVITRDRTSREVNNAKA